MDDDQAEVEVAPPEQSEGASPPSATSERRDPVKADALRRLKKLEARSNTVGTHLDELRALMTLLFQRLPD